MTPEQALAVLFSVAAAGTPGPSNALLPTTGAQVGVLRVLNSRLQNAGALVTSLACRRSGPQRASIARTSHRAASPAGHGIACK